jgi:hypothetical protein
MQSGLGYQQVDESPSGPSDGSMAIFCPACPQPGINLPDDWQKRFTGYGFPKHAKHLIANCIIENNLLEPS